MTDSEAKALGLRAVAAGMAERPGMLVLHYDIDGDRDNLHARVLDSDGRGCHVLADQETLCPFEHLAPGERHLMWEEVGRGLIVRGSRWVPDLRDPATIGALWAEVMAVPAPHPTHPFTRHLNEALHLTQTYGPLASKVVRQLVAALEAAGGAR